MIKLSLKPKRESIVLQGEKGEEEYYIMEMTAEERDDYLQVLSSRVNGEQLKDFRGVQAELLSRSMKKKKDGSPVTKEEIQQWPSSVVTTLHELAQKINLLSEEEGKKIVGNP